MAGGVLGPRPDVEHQHLAALETPNELVSPDDVHAVPRAQVRAGQTLDPGHVVGRHVAKRRPQLAHSLGGERVEDTGAVAPRGNQPGAGDGPQVVGGVGDALVDLGGDVVDRALALGQEVDQLGPASAGHGLADLSEAVVESVLGRPVTHEGDHRPGRGHCQVLK